MLSEEMELYTSLSLMAEIGGYVGLLLGVSLWHFATWISDSLEVKIKDLESKYDIRVEVPYSSNNISAARE
jgi:hypothetical protein